MDKRVAAREDGTLYLAEWPIIQAVQQQKRHGLLYYAMLGMLALFLLGSLAVAFFFRILSHIGVSVNENEALRRALLDHGRSIKTKNKQEEKTQDLVFENEGNLTMRSYLAGCLNLWGGEK